MPLARFEHDFTDASGNVLTGVGTVTVRREDTSVLASPFSDRDGTVALGNPFSVTGGAVAFHVVGGSYRIDIAFGAETRTLRHVAVGTASEQDAETLSFAGLSYQFEAATAAPPSAGSIRADNPDLSLATKLYIADETLGGSDFSASLLDLDPDGSANLHRLFLRVNATDVSFEVSSATAQSGYTEIDVSGHDGSAALDAGTCKLTIERAGQDGVHGLAGGLTGATVNFTATRAVTGADDGARLEFTGSSAAALTFSSPATMGADRLFFVQNLGTSDLTLSGVGLELDLTPGRSALVFCDGTTYIISHQLSDDDIVDTIEEDVTVTGSVIPDPRCIYADIELYGGGGKPQQINPDTAGDAGAAGGGGPAANVKFRVAVRELGIVSFDFIIAAIQDATDGGTGNTTTYSDEDGSGVEKNNISATGGEGSSESKTTGTDIQTGGNPGDVVETLVDPTTTILKTNYGITRPTPGFIFGNTADSGTGEDAIGGDGGSTPRGVGGKGAVTSNGGNASNAGGDAIGYGAGGGSASITGNGSTVEAGYGGPGLGTVKQYLGAAA